MARNRSNQNGVARGELDQATAWQLMHDMLTEALVEHPPRTRIEMCLCDEAVDCVCRKPAPGLLLRLMDHFGVTPERRCSWATWPSTKKPPRVRVSASFGPERLLSSGTALRVKS